MITFQLDLPADNTDCFAGSQLDPVPSPGILFLWLASSQRDGILSVTGPGITGAYRIPPTLRTSGIPDLSADMPILIPTNGGKIICDYDEVTAGDAFLTVLFLPL